MARLDPTSGHQALNQCWFLPQQSFANPLVRFLVLLHIASGLTRSSFWADKFCGFRGTREDTALTWLVAGMWGLVPGSLLLGYLFVSRRPCCGWVIENRFDQLTLTMGFAFSQWNCTGTWPYRIPKSRSGSWICSYSLYPGAYHAILNGVFRPMYTIQWSLVFLPSPAPIRFSYSTPFHPLLFMKSVSTYPE
jgi:hypothetical protein